MDKKTVRSKCLEVVANRIKPVREAMEEAQVSANAETKSTAGDKHEISRAMAQGERDRLAQQLHNLQMLYSALEKLNVAPAGDSIEIGSYIESSVGDFFVSVGLGEVKTEGFRFFAIAAHSPVGQQLIGKRVGDSFNLGPREAQVQAFY